MKIKHLWITMIIAAGISLNATAQINLENNFTGLAYFAYLDNEYFYQPDYTNSTCIVYDLNYNVINTFNLTPPTNLYLYDVAYLSQHIFNTDDALEVLVVYYNYIPTSDTSGYYIYTTQVVNENGDILMDVPNGAYSEIIQYDDETLKLMIYLYDFSTSIYVTNTLVYSIPGTIPTEIDEFKQEYTTQIFPNPASSQANIKYNINKQGKAKLIISSLEGQLVHTELLDAKNNVKPFNTSHLKPGTYMVYIEQNGQKTPAQKLVIN